MTSDRADGQCDSGPHGSLKARLGYRDVIGPDSQLGYGVAALAVGGCCLCS